MKDGPCFGLQCPLSLGRNRNDSDNVYTLFIPLLLAETFTGFYRVEKVSLLQLQVVEFLQMLCKLVFFFYSKNSELNFCQNLGDNSVSSDKAGSLFLVSHQPESKLA